MDIFYLRAAERILIAISGLVCIFLGYGLFRLSFTKIGRSNAELVAKGGGFELTLRSVWPGAFFAAFGMIILVFSIITQLKASHSTGTTSESQDTYIYQSGGHPPANSESRAKNAIFAIGELLAIDSSGGAENSPERVMAISRLAIARNELVDVAYGEGSYERFNEIMSKSRTPTEFTALPEADRLFFEDLKSTLQR